MNEVTLFTPGEVTLQELTVEELRDRLASSLELSARHLIHLSAIWAELERRGEDLSALRSGIAVYLPMIATGQLDAQLVVRYAGQNMLLRHLAMLPPDDQARLIADDRVTVVDLIDGEFVETQTNLSEIDSRRLRDIFSDHVLSPAEQRQKAAVSGVKRRRSAALAKASASGLRGKPAADEKVVNIQLRITDDEHEAAKIYARSNGVSLGSLIRALLSREVKR